MNPWGSVHVTRARQVGELMELRNAELAAPEVPVHAHYEQLRASDSRQALGFIGHALPRAAAIHWAAALVAAQPSGAQEDRAALDQVLAWCDQPSDDRRRHAYALAQMADLHAPERTLATALFYSGGSIAPANLNPVHPAPALANRLAVVAIVEAAYRGGDPQAFFAEALRRAEAIAEHGIAART
ncbi:DUF6931 family protein [Sphingomonas sp. S2-65]|uniref:DUF6931 family protein n=1 Tax=Sphingomonas sp. S2-65 TaxID=2903960 RepID=UPI001F30C319|nr:hypothetical protein [Sphingomonas sp. S2-65]UYY57211.1 hypothetical protein LZ586_10980 [Sphingomonas sp. S2-65]